MKHRLHFIIKDICRAVNFLVILRQELGLEIGYMESMRIDSPPALENFKKLFNTFKNVCTLFDENYLPQEELGRYGLRSDVAERMDSTTTQLRRAHELLTAAPSENRMKVRFAETYRIICELSEEILPNLKTRFESFETYSK